MATDWTAIRTEYLSGVEPAALAKKYKVKEAAVRQQATRHGWVEERRRLSQNVASKALAASVRTRTENLIKFNDDCLKCANNILVMASRQMTSTGGVMPASDIRALSGSVESAQRTGRIALGADSDSGPEVRPDAVIGFRVIPYSTPDG